MLAGIVSYVPYASERCPGDALGRGHRSRSRSMGEGDNRSSIDWDQARDISPTNRYIPMVVSMKSTHESVPFKRSVAKL